MIGLVVASEPEARPFLADLPWRGVAQQPFKVYQVRLNPSQTPLVLVISGMGKVAAAVATHILICNYGVGRIFNVGVCGALHDDGFNPGAVFRITSALEGDRMEGPRQALAERCASEPFTAMPTARLVTCDRPVFDTRTKKELSLLGELVDMEGAAVARVANLYQVSCVLLKGITDGAGEGGRAVLIRHLESVSRRLATTFLNEIESFRQTGDDAVNH